ncbi:hypothetical protein ACW9ST_005212, partial [Klebsiella quasipneumoniae]
QSKDWAFLRFNKNPVPKGAGFFAVWGMPPGGAALTGATDPTWGYAPVARPGGRSTAFGKKIA